ncbi:MAG: response regulator [Bacteroidales bacterium]|nr:response regulator [Bacteroidales bacterium]
MNKNVTIIIAEDDEGHAFLIKRNLSKSGLINPIIHFKDGDEVLNFFKQISKGELADPGKGYIVLLDIKMPKVDGTEVLEKMKSDQVLRKIPIIMITTTDAPAEVELCHKLGCNSYIVKPIDYEKFIDVVKRLGYFLEIVEIPNAG